MRKQHLMFLALLCMAVSSVSYATTTVYTGRAGWETAVGVYEEEGFSDSTLNPGITVTTNAGSVGSGVWNDQLVPGVQTTMFTFASPLVGYGANWNLAGPGGPGTGIALLLDGVLVGTEIPNSYSGGFWGVTSTVAFNQVLLTAGTQSGWAETFNMDNMVYAAGSPPIPEPVTMFSAFMAISSVGMYIRKRIKGQAVA